MRHLSFTVLVLLVSLIAYADAKKLSADDCKVCIDVVNGIEKTITDSDKNDITLIEDKISAYCKKKATGSEQKKICYHLDPIKRELSRPLSFSMPTDDICIRKLNKKNPEFCSVKYSADKPSSSESSFDPSKLRISQLKSYLAERGQKCTGCYEKNDFVRKVKEVMEAEL